MRAIQKVAAAPGAELRDIPEWRVSLSTDVLVRVEAASICGTDYHVYAWDAWSAARVRPPRVMGHEFAGKVIEVGSEVAGLAVGDYVTGESHWVCGRCRQCRTGQAHVCEDTRIFGVDADGCFSPLALVPEASLWRNPPGLAPELACLQDPLGNAVHALLAGEVAGAVVAVLGCGPIGLFAIAAARACGASTVLATDTRPFRLELAAKLGADAVCNAADRDAEAWLRDATQGAGADVVLEMSGAPTAIAQAMRMTRRGGRVSLMGIPSRKVELDIAEDMIFRGLTIECIVGRRLYQTWDTMSALLGSGRLDVRPILTHQIPLEDFAAGMDLMRDGLCGKVVFRM